MEKEKYWSKFADDFEELNNYVVGKSDMDIILNELSKQKNLGNTLELACGSGTYSELLAKELFRSAILRQQFRHGRLGEIMGVK